MKEQQHTLRPSWITLAPGKWNILHALTGLLIAVICLGVVPFVYSILVPSTLVVEGQEPAVTAGSMAVLPLQFFVMFILSVMVIFMWNHGKHRNETGALTAPVSMQSYFLGVGGGLLFLAIGQIAIYTLPGMKDAGSQVANHLAFGRSLGLDIVLATAICIAAPLGEELLYRGIIFRSLYDHVSRSKFSGVLMAIGVPMLISSVIFAATHTGPGQEQQFFIFIVWGIIASVIYLRTNSLYPIVIGHSVSNTANVFIMTSSTGAAHPVVYVYVALAPVLVAGVLYLSHRVLGKRVA